MQFTLLYIDDDDVYSTLLDGLLNDYFNINYIDPKGKSLSEIEELLDSRSFDFLIIDYHLKEKGGCSYNGDEILNSFTHKFPHFPSMLLTSHAEEAISLDTTFNTNTIHSKEELNNDITSSAFIAKIQKNITVYRDKLVSKQAELDVLIQKKLSGVALSSIEEQELINLDKYLDEIDGGDSKKIADEVKKPSNESRIAQLLEKTDILIDKLEQL